jgi:MOSC domain-containing protein YiiM
MPSHPIVESIAVGEPRRIRWRGEEILTSIFKAPVTGPVIARRHNLDGDRQADLTVHGGEHKAVYTYAAEHYDWWRDRLGRELAPAQFGENLTVRGLDEQRVGIGDVFRVGEAELEATQPRLPCYKLGVRFGDPAIVKAFARSRRWGIYFRVVREGPIAAGDRVIPLERHPAGIPVYDLARVYVFDRGDRETMARLASHDRLEPGWRAWLEKRLPAAGGS